MNKAVTKKSVAGASADKVDEVISEYRTLVKGYQPAVLDFEFCGGYILQAARNGLGCKKFEEGLVIYTQKLHTGEPVILAAVGKERARYIAETAKELFTQLGKVVIIKNVGKELERDLLVLGCRHYRVDEWWDDISKYDDNSFPEVILGVQRLAKLVGNEYAKIRKELNLFNRLYEIEIEHWPTCSPFMIQDIFDDWLENMHARNQLDRDQLRASHEMFCDDRDYLVHIGIKDKKNAQLIGYLVFSEISSICLGFNAMLNNFSYKNSYRVFLLEAVKIAHDLGYRYLNIQGSEDTHQYISKKWLVPELEIKKEHLIYDGNLQ